MSRVLCVQIGETGTFALHRLDGRDREAQTCDKISFIQRRAYLKWFFASPLKGTF